MNQVWNIFRKDARHHWPEIAASLALLAAFAWLDIRSWNQPDGLAAAGGFSFLLVARFLPGLLNALYPLSWIFLIVRVVHGESLVGDQQFWVTRPYDWKRLVAAKVIFVLAFINFPLFSMDVFLLARAGFHPIHYVVGLLWMQLMWILLLFLPVASLATVTRTIPQILLVGLFLLLYLLGMIGLSEVVPNSNFSTGSDWWTALLLVATSVTIILTQYSRRWTTRSRWLIAGLCSVLTLIMIVTPYRSLIAREYPTSKEELPVQLTLLPAAKYDGSYFPSHGGTASISLPMRVSGLPKDSFLKLDGIVATLDNSRGFHWDSGWQVQAKSIFPDANKVDLYFNIKQNVFNQLKSAQVNLHLLLAFTLYHDQNQTQFIVPDGEFNLPGIGICTDSAQPWNPFNCRAALRRPSFLLVTSEPATSTCPLRREEAPPPPGHFARGSARGGGSDPAEMGISPIRQFDIYLSDWEPPGTHFTNPGICPGTPITLSNPQVMVRRRIELQFDNVALTDYQQGEYSVYKVIAPRLK